MHLQLLTPRVAGSAQTGLDIQRKAESAGRSERIPEELRKGNKYDQNTLYKILNELIKNKRIIHTNISIITSTCIHFS